MSMLPGYDGWHARLATRSRFMESCAAEAIDLGNRFRAPLPVEAVDALPRDTGREALTRLVRIDLRIGAAELAFCLDETARAVELIRLALIELRELLMELRELLELRARPGMLMFLSRQAYFGVLASEESVAVRDSHLRISGFEARWSAIGTAEELSRNLAALVFAGLGSGAPQENAQIVMTAAEADQVSGPARLAFMASPEAAIVGLFGVARPRSFVFFDTPEIAQEYTPTSMRQAFEEAITLGHAALAMMEYSYQRRIDLLRSNALSWKSIAPKTSMVDWPLLMVHVALLRRQRADFLEQTAPIGDAAVFIRNLAKELSARGY